MSTFQDGTGQLALENDQTLPGWRDFERAVAAVFGGNTQENKAVFDVLIPDTMHPGVHFGISGKMRQTLNETKRTGRITIELSNSASKFWKALNTLGLAQDTYRQRPEQVGQALIQLVSGWHQATVDAKKRIDLSKSCFLVLSWEMAGNYQLHQFPLSLPLEGITWTFPVGETRLRGDDESGRIYEWYGESGGQLKYYPQASKAVWSSHLFRLESLRLDKTDFGIRAKAARYFPDLWVETEE